MDENSGLGYSLPMMPVSLLLWSLSLACSPFHHLPTATPPAEIPPVRYRCDDDVRILVVYQNIDGQDDLAFVRVVGRTDFTPMTSTPAASGARYANGHLVWWSAGDEGFLQRADSEWDGKILLRNCVSTPPETGDAP